MAATAHERFGSRRKTGPQSYEFLYYVDGTTVETDAENAALAASPSTYLDLLNQGVTDFEVISGNLFFVTIAYGIRDYGDADQTQFFEFDTTGGTQHVTYSKQTIHKYTVSGTAADHKQAIGVDSEGKNPAGVDVPVEKFDFSVRRKISAGDVDSAYIASLYACTAKYNTQPFTVTLASGITISFAAGEVLFLGAKGGPVSSTQWDINFAFSASPNIDGSSGTLDVGDITGISKKGWEYLWVQYTPAEDAAAKALVSRPRYAYVEKVLNTADLDDLEIS